MNLDPKRAISGSLLEKRLILVTNFGFRDGDADSGWPEGVQGLLIPMAFNSVSASDGSSSDGA